jgi:hypothetical protein
MNTESTTVTSGHIYEFAEAGNDRGNNPLVLGFAYSLTPEGAPGLYNRILAQTIITDWVGRNPWIGVQWEIRDAMDDPRLYSDLLNQLNQHTPRTTALLNRLGSSPVTFNSQGVHTAPPCDPIAAKKEGKDAVDWRAFRQRLQDSLDTNGDPAVAALAETVAAIAKQVGYTGTDDKAVLQAAIYSSEQVAVYLNRLTQTEQNFHRRFWWGNEAILELHDRQRQGFGPVGFEGRDLPANERNLGQYQNQRVNSLIVEAICPERSILPEPGYLSTRGVLQHLFSEMPNNRRDFDRVFIYGSPVHSARCKRQFIEFAWSVDWSVDPGQITIIYFGDDMSDCGWIWDEETAQVWCRSKAGWDAYETNNARLR